MNVRNDMSLYALNTAAWDRVADAGGDCLREMAKHFTICSDMDRALGFKNATANWHGGRGGPSANANRRARVWLQTKDHPADPANTVSEKTQSNGSGDVLLVACPPGVAEKAKRVLAVLGCDVTEV